MKTFKNLYPKYIAFVNLEQAFRKARRGKRGLPHVAAFEHNLDQELLNLQGELQAQTYQPGGYRHFMVYDGKPPHLCGPFPRPGRPPCPLQPHRTDLGSAFHP